jgi:biofilm PGA synthesis N-glycosyltransferase PgaC
MRLCLVKLGEPLIATHGELVRPSHAPTSEWVHPYVTTTAKFYIAVAAAVAWAAFSIWAAHAWTLDLARYLTPPGAMLIVALIAIVPGFMNAFLVASLLLDRRPPRRPQAAYPPISVIIAAYNEEACIGSTVQRLLDGQYPAPLEVIVVDDGSADGTVAALARLRHPSLRVIRAQHGGKACCLNRGLREARHDIIVTVDADTFLFRDALTRIVERLQSDPANTTAVAGAVLVRNSRDGFVARMQEWDYFHGIASIKRVQSLYHGTLVAQGAFSAYRKQALLDIGGWPDVVGEDIVMTWALLRRGDRIGYAEDAVAFTVVPSTYKAFFRQRKRWSRGLIEAFKRHPQVLAKPRLNSLFIYWNLLYPLLDFVYLTVFIPGVILAFFHHYLIAGPMTLAVLPLAILVNLLMFSAQRPMLSSQGLRVRRNYAGFLLFLLAYGVFMYPATVAGYGSELLGLARSWGTK